MEQPNLNYINELSGDSLDFKSKIIAILKRELPEEIEMYKNHIQNDANSLAADMVHKLKHKISILGLEKSYYLAEEFENGLKNNSLQLQPQFENILASMIEFVESL